MKKLFLASVFALGTLTAMNAQDKQQEKQSEQTEMKEPTAMNKKAEATPPKALTQDYKEVKTAQLPQAVQEAVAKQFENTSISKAYVNQENEYKLVLASKDSKKANQTVYVNSEGEWIKQQ